MKISPQTKKLMALFSSITIMIIILGVFSTITMSIMNGKVKEMNEVWLLGVDLAHTIETKGTAFRLSEYKHIVSTSSQEKSFIEEQISVIDEEITKTIKEYRDTATLKKDVALAEAVSNAWSEYIGTHKQMLEVSNQLDMDTAMQFMDVELQENFDELSQAVDALVKFNQDNASKSYAHTANLYNKMKIGLMSLLAIATAVSIAVTSIVVTGINNPMQELKRIAQKVAAGDLREKANVKVKNEFAELAQHFNEMIDNLRDILGKIGENSSQIAAMSEELNSSADQNAKATEQVAITIQEIASGADTQVNKMDDMTGLTSQIDARIQKTTENAQLVAASSLEAANSAHIGNNEIKTAVEQMNIINSVVSHSTDVVTQLGEKIRRIGSIVNLIANIADQTNLLALNAAIEAARAGDAGRGFAVVAEEVRKLAEQSARATEDITRITNEIQTDASEAVTTMYNGNQSVKQGAEVVANAGEAFESILSVTQEVSHQIQEVSESMMHMSRDSERLIENASEVLEIANNSSSSTQNAASAAEEQTASMEEIAASAGTLATMAEELQSVVLRFKL